MKTPKQAEAEGYTIDRHTYPHFAYKGPRFRPTESFCVLTDREAYYIALFAKLEAHCQVQTPETVGNPKAHADEGNSIRAEIKAVLEAVGAMPTPPQPKGK